MIGSWQHWVFLSDEQIKYAAKVGTARQIESASRNRKHRNNLPSDYARDLRRNIQAAKSELAGKVFLGPQTRWNEFMAFGKADLNDFIDVKAVVKKSHRLIAAVDGFHPQRAYLSVYCEEPWFWVRGWKWGHEMKTIEKLETNRPCYVVENNELHDPTILFREKGNA